MHHVSRIVVLQLLALLATALPVGAQTIDLTPDVWDLLGQDTTGWSGSQLKFTSQGADGSLTGYFDWVSTNRSKFGRELFDGMLSQDRTFTLHGFQIVAHPVFGSPRGIVLSDYTGEVTADGEQIVNGTWIGRNGVRGTWESVRIPVPEPSSALLLAIGALAGTVRRRRPK